MKKLIAFMLLLVPVLAFATHIRNYLDDIIWSKKTDQMEGFYMVKFSKTDSFIVGHGYEKAIFYNALTGDEIIRLPFNAEVHFFDNDKKFIQLAPSRDRLVIYNTKTFIPIDTLEYDDKQIGSITISKDENLLAGIISNGLRIWDLKTGKILQEKEFEKEKNLVGIRATQIVYTNDNSKLIFLIERTYKENEQNYYTIQVEVWNAKTLIKEDNYKDKFSFRLSNTNKYIAFQTDDKYNGVEIYDFNTKQLLIRLPVNGPSLTGIEFSPYDKYIVASNGPGQNSLVVFYAPWRDEVYRYIETSFMAIDISHDGYKIVNSVGKYLDLIYTKFPTSIQEIGENPTQLYPNPATDYVDITIDNHTLQGMGGTGTGTYRTRKDAVRVYDVLGVCVLEQTAEHLAVSRHSSARGELMRIDVSGLSAGVYFVLVDDRMYKFVKL